MARYQKPEPVMIDATQLFTAAAAAHRINNGEYIKAQYFDLRDAEVQKNVQTNRQIMDSILSGEIQPTQEDADMAEAIRTHFKGLTFELLKGKILNQYSAKALSLSTLDEINARDINVVASLPSVYVREVKRKSIDERLADCEQQHIGTIGSEVTLKGEVVKCFASIQYNCHFATVITDTNQSVFFATKNKLQVGSKIDFKGKVKAHREGFQTQLNYVKVFTKN